MTLFLKADLTPEEQMQRVIRKYPEADFSSISQFRTRNSLVAGGKNKQTFGQEEEGGCGGIQGWLSRALRQQVLSGVGIA